MNEYRVGLRGNEILCDVIGIFALMLLGIIGVIVTESYAAFIPNVLFGFIGSFIFVLFLLYHLVLLSRYRQAIKGTKSIAKVTGTREEKYKSTRYYRIEFIYIDSNNDKAKGIQYVSYDEYILINKGDEIPVHVYGLYAAFIPSEVVEYLRNKEEVIIKDEIKKEKFVYLRCDYCDQRLNESDTYCPHCGARRL